LMRNPDQIGRFQSGSRSVSWFRSRSQNELLVVAFAVGLVLGWVVIGWWLWPVRWTNSEPWQMRPEYQRTYVALVAASYQQTGDVVRARGAVDGWDDRALAGLLAKMGSDASTQEERQRLTDLAEALGLPEVKEGESMLLLDQRIVVLSALMSALPLVLVIIVAVSPLLREGARESEGLPRQGVGSAAAELEDDLERLLAGEEEEEWGYQWEE
jgi:hypothetical protein